MKPFLSGQGRGDEGCVGCDTSPDLNFVGKIHTYSNLSANYRILMRLNTPFPNLFSLTTCHMETRPYLGNLYNLMKENEEKHWRHT